MQRKIHNQTLFVAALSVYLGLLIVGAPPQVLAQTALPQSVKQEVENDSELDCPNPQNDEVEDLIEFDYANPFEEFVQNLRKLILIKEFRTSQYFKLEYAAIKHCPVEGHFITTSIIANEINADNWVKAALSDLLDKDYFDYLADCIPNDKIADKNGAEVSLKLINHNDELQLEVAVRKASPQAAIFFAENLNQAFIIAICNEEDRIPKLIYENTKASAKKDQVFIVTRLPRAGLDALLKADEKAN